MEDTQIVDCTQVFNDHAEDNDEQRLIGLLEFEEFQYEIYEGTFKIGRDPATCDILLQNQKTISKEHAIIEAESACTFLMDLGSRNKTKLGKVAIKPHVRYALQGGEHLQFGSVKALFSKYIKTTENEEGNLSDDSESMLTSEDIISSPNRNCVNQSSDASVISPTPQVSSKFSPGKSLGGKKISSGFVPETPGVSTGDKQWNFSNVIIESPSSQSTPFPSNLRSSLKNFTSPAFLSPIEQEKSLVNTKISLLSESVDLPIKSKKSVAFKLSYSNEEEKKYPDSSSDESTDIEEFFNESDNAKHKNSVSCQSFSMKSKCKDDIFNMATQPHSVESEKPLDIDISNADANTQELLQAFGGNETLRDTDNTQDIFKAFKESTHLCRNSLKSDYAEAQTFQNNIADNKTFRPPVLPSFTSSRNIAGLKKVAIQEDMHEAATQIFHKDCISKRPCSAMKFSKKDKASDEEDIFDMPTQPFLKSNKLLKARTNINKNDSAVGDVGDTTYEIYDAPTQAFQSPQKLPDPPDQICGAAEISNEVDKDNVELLDVNELVTLNNDKIQEKQDVFNSFKDQNKCNHDKTDSNLSGNSLSFNDDSERALAATQVFSKSHMILPEQESTEMNSSLPTTQVFSPSNFQDFGSPKPKESLPDKEVLPNSSSDLDQTQVFSPPVALEKCSEDLDCTQVFCPQNIVSNVDQDLCASNNSLPPAQSLIYPHLERKDHNDLISILPLTQIFSVSHLTGKDHDDHSSSLPPTQIFSLSHLQDNDRDNQNSSLPPTQIFSLSHLQGKDHDDPNCSLPPTQVFSKSYFAGISSNRNGIFGGDEDSDDDNSSCSSETLLTVTNEPHKADSLPNMAKNCLTINPTGNNCPASDVNFTNNVSLQHEDNLTGYNSDESTDVEDAEYLNHPSKEINNEILGSDNIANSSSSSIKCTNTPNMNKPISEEAMQDVKNIVWDYNSDESTDVENELSSQKSLNNRTRPIPSASEKLPIIGSLDNTLKVSTVVNKPTDKENKSLHDVICGYNSDDSTDIENEISLSKCKVDVTADKVISSANDAIDYSDIVRLPESAKSPSFKQMQENISPDTSLDMTDTPSELYPNLVVVVPTQLVDLMLENSKSPFNGSNDSQHSPCCKSQGDNHADHEFETSNNEDSVDGAMDVSQELFNLNSPHEAYSINGKYTGKKSVSSLTSTPTSKNLSFTSFKGFTDNYQNSNDNITKSTIGIGCQFDTPTLSRYKTDKPNDAAICLGEKNSKEMLCNISKVNCKRKLIVPDSPDNNNIECSNDNASSSSNMVHQKKYNLRLIGAVGSETIDEGSIIENAKKSGANSMKTRTTRNGRRSIAPTRYSPDRLRPSSSCLLKHNDLKKEQIIPRNKSTRNEVRTKETSHADIGNKLVLDSHLIVCSRNNNVDERKLSSDEKATIAFSEKCPQDCENINSSVNKIMEKYFVTTSCNNSSACEIKTNVKQIKLDSFTFNDDDNIKNCKNMLNLDLSNSLTKNDSDKHLNSRDHVIPLTLRTRKVRKRKASLDNEADVFCPKKTDRKNIKDELLILGSLSNVGTNDHTKQGNIISMGTEDPSGRADVNGKISHSECNIIDKNQCETLISSTTKTDIPNEKVSFRQIEKQFIEVLNSATCNLEVTSKTTISNTNVIEDINADNNGNCDKNSCQQEPINKGIRKRGRPKKSSIVIGSVKPKTRNGISEQELPIIDAAMENCSIVKEVSYSDVGDIEDQNITKYGCSQNICSKALLGNEINKNVTQDMQLISQKDNSDTKISESEDVMNEDIKKKSGNLPVMKSTRNSRRLTARKISVVGNDTNLVPKDESSVVKRKLRDTNNIDKNGTMTRKNRNASKEKTLLSSDINKRIVSPGSQMIVPKDTLNTEMPSPTYVSKADPIQNNENDPEIRKNRNSGRRKANKFISVDSIEILSSNKIGSKSEEVQSCSNKEMNCGSPKSKVESCETITEGCTKNTRGSTRNAAVRNASVINVVNRNDESISLEANVKCEVLSAPDVKELITNKRKRTARIVMDAEKTNSFCRNSKGNKSEESVAAEFNTNNKSTENNETLENFNLSCRPTRASKCRNIVEAMNVLSQRAKKADSSEPEVLTSQISISVQKEVNKAQVKRQTKSGKDILVNKSKYRQESLGLTKDKYINAENNPVCDTFINTVMPISVHEMKCSKQKRNGSVSESVPSVRSTRSKRGSSPSFSRETILWSPSQRQAMANKQPRVLFTSYKDDKDEKLIITMGGNLVETVNECTVLVTNAVRRTCKFLASLGKGVPIVSDDWLVSSKQAGNFVDPWQFLIVDKESEKKFDFNLKSALMIAKKKNLFSGYSIYVTDSVKPPPDQMREIIECAGGEYLEMAPKINTEKILVISCEEDKNTWKNFKKLGLPILHAEFILSGLLKQQIRIKENLLVDS